MRRAALVALTLAAFGAAGGSVAARAQAPSPAAPAPVGTAAPRAGAALDPTPSAQTPAPLTPAQAPTSSPAAASAVVEPPPPGFDPRVCGRGGLTPSLAQACRNDFMRKVEADRARIEARREADRIAREERAARRAPHLAPRPAQLDFFFAEQLGYGDVVMTDKGARVYIGKSDDPPRREDFVPLDDPRSPRRALPARLKRAPQGL